VKIAHLSSVHPPFDTRIFHRECQTLAGAGHEVVLITPSNGGAAEGTIRIIQIPLPRTRAERFLRTVWQVYSAAVRENADVYQFHDAELIIVGCLLRARGKKVIYDVHEDVPQDILIKNWIPRPLRRWISLAAHWTEMFGVACFNGVVAATPKIASRFPSKKTVLVQNFPRIKELECNELTPYQERPNAAVYVGSITPVRGIREMIEANALVASSLDSRMDVAGIFDDLALLDELKASPGWQTARYHGQLSRAEVRKLLATARAGLVCFHPGPNHTESQPNKLFEYMSAGIPVIASDFPLWHKLIGEAGCGLLVDPLDPKQIAAAIEWVFTHPSEAEEMGKKGRAAVISKYNWEVEGNRLVEFYERFHSEAAHPDALPVT